MNRKSAQEPAGARPPSAPIISSSRGTDVSRLRDIARRRKRAHTALRAAGSKVYEAFLDMEKAAYADSALPRKVKELIAVGISIVRDCESCMQWHVEQAAKAGASKPEVLEAVEVGIEMGGGPATVSARFALEVMEDVFGA
jgi:AhpD family alkylhydroperoxidase